MITKLTQAMSFSKNSVRMTIRCISETSNYCWQSSVQQSQSKHLHMIKDSEVWTWGEKTASVVALASLKMRGVHTVGSTLMPYLKKCMKRGCVNAAKGILSRNNILLVDVLEEEPDSRQAEHEERPVHDPLVVLEPGGPREQRVLGSVDPVTVQ